jgi:hypothetical protein
MDHLLHPLRSRPARNARWTTPREAGVAPSALFWWLAAGRKGAAPYSDLVAALDYARKAWSLIYAPGFDPDPVFDLGPDDETFFLLPPTPVAGPTFLGEGQEQGRHAPETSGVVSGVGFLC